jgi:hypothetical protein
MQLEGAMRLATVEIDRDRGDSNVREDERRYDVAPPRKIEQTGENHLEILPLESL